MVVGRRPTRSPVPAHVLLLLSHLELAPIGWQLFGLGNFLNDQAAVSLAVDTFATRLLAQALSLLELLGERLGFPIGPHCFCLTPSSAGFPFLPENAGFFL